MVMRDIRYNAPSKLTVVAYSYLKFHFDRVVDSNEFNQQSVEYGADKDDASFATTPSYC